MINVGEYGLSFNLHVSYDLSPGALVMVFSRPDNTVFSGIPLVGMADLTTPDQGTFPAKMYATYTFKDGDLNQPGEYRVRLTYTDASKRLISDVTSFDVYP